MIIIFSFIYNCQVSGQEKINISAGLGLPELINIGIRLQSKQTQFGLTIGSMPLGSDENILSLSTDFYFHFAGFSKFSNRRPWYGRIGLNYLRDETLYSLDEYYYLNTRVGKDLNISEKIGIDIDGGLLILLRHGKIIKKEHWFLEIEIPVLPSAGISFFYRI